ncbi:MAG: TetR/AcrR family transcriptional regulator [Bacteroidota bacterium]
MKRKTRNPAKAKQEIIEKSAPIFNQYGYAGTRLEMLIKATGYQKGGIYNHFGSKMELAQAAFQHNFSLLKDTYFQAMTVADTPKNQLIAFLEGFKKYIVQPPIKGGCPILNMAIEVDDTDETNRLLVKAALDEWKEMIEAVLAKGLKTGDFKADINVQQEALFIIASIEGSIMLGQLKRSAKLMLGVADSLRKYIELRVFS